MLQLQKQIDKATSSQLVKDIGDLSKQFGVDMKDVMTAMRTTSSFVGTFRTGLLQELSQRSMSRVTLLCMVACIHNTDRARSQIIAQRTKRGYSGG